MPPAGAPWILGTGSSFHNGAACLLRGDELVVAIQEATLSVRYCLEHAGIRASDLSLVANCLLMGGQSRMLGSLRHCSMLTFTQGPPPR